MELKLIRKYKCDAYTIGALFVDGVYYCDTMEDRDRGLRQDMNEGEIERLKVYGETAIPTGRYKVLITYSPKYKRMMPQIMNVKGFAGIRIHSGTTAADSLGCVLVGQNKVKGKVINSRATYAVLFDVMQRAQDINIEIV